MSPSPEPQAERSLRGPLLVAGVLVLALGAAGWGRPTPLVPPLYAAGACYLLAALLALRRAPLYPAETLGWRLLALSLLLMMFSIVLGSAWPFTSLPLGTQKLLWFGSRALHQLLLILGVLAWPWQEVRSHRRILHLTGSLLFSGSLLLSLWFISDWGTSFSLASLLDANLLTSSMRIGLLGWVVLYLVFESPQRVYGALGWLLLNTLAGTFITGLIDTLVSQGQGWLRPFGSLVLVAPLSLALAAYSGRPVEASDPADDSYRRRWELLPYLPFLLAGSLVMFRFVSTPRRELLGVLGMSLLSALLVVRQLVLLRELRRANDDLEARVQTRTRELQLHKAAALRTERMNTMALLGAGLVHDLNNALMVIHQTLDFCELDIESGRGIEPASLNQIRGAADGVSALGQRLLSFGHQREDEPREALDVAEVLRNFEPILRMALPGRLRLDLEVGPAPHFIEGTRSHLEQALLNLVVNAKDAIPAQGTITISLHRQGAWVDLSVADTGTGLSEEVRRHLFEPFFTTKPKGQGTGLGLASMRALLEADGGRIEASNVEGGGTRFRIRFPRLGSPDSIFS